jgi:hypothetical protein
MSFRIPVHGTLAFATAAVALAIGSAGASGAVPIKKGVYRGQTSQSRPIVLKMTRSVRRQDEAFADLRTACGRTGRVTLFAGSIDARVSRSGRFRTTEISADFADLGPFFDNGRRRDLFDVTRYEFSGRFVTRRRVRGQWRARSVLLDRDTFLGEAAVDRCDTGVVSWSARLRRR